MELARYTNSGIIPAMAIQRIEVLRNNMIMGILKIKRIYDKPSKDDGIRIFVDRLWARGVTKERAHLDYWFKDIAPSSELRKWFNHEPEKFKEFKKCYKKELTCKSENVNEILELLKKNNVTLIYAAKHPTVNHAIVLQDYINSAKNKFSN